MIYYFIIALCVLLFARLALWYKTWKSHAAKFPTSGYTPPRAGFMSALCYAAACRFVTFMTVGSVKVIRTAEVPKTGRCIFAANHQLPCDFAMLRRGSGRHMRMLTAAEQLEGNFGVISAWFGAISVAFKQKSDGQAAERACTAAVAEPDGTLGIFPQGALLPDNVLKKEEFRPGCIRMARGASEMSHDDVSIIPVAIHYRRSPQRADWTHRFLRKYRSLFPALRNPRNWNPLFKLDAETLEPGEKARVLAEREQALQAYKNTRATNFGGVVVVGAPIKVSTLPQDPLQAIEVVRVQIAELLAVAERN